MGYNLSIAQILGLGEEVRAQNPKIQSTTGLSPRWYIRPYVDRLGPSGERTTAQERIYLGSRAEMSKRQAITEKNRIMATINKSLYVVQSQINFGAFLDEYENKFVRRNGNLAGSTQDKYLSHLKNHIRPAFSGLMMAEIDTKRIDEFLALKAKAKLSSSTRTDLRNLLSGIFTQADKWGYWKEKNPALAATVGRHRPARPRRKHSYEETVKLLAALHPDVRSIIHVALSLTLRISEVFGLQEKHLDFTEKVVRVRQRYYRGDLDETKTPKSRRDIPMEMLESELRSRCKGDPERFVFSVTTNGQHKKRECRDDRDINQHFLRPAAKALGIYYKGFGFHHFRHQAVTALNATDPMQAQKISGHTKPDMGAHYEMEDRKRQADAIRQHQEKFLIN
jgi:integrase